MKLDIQFLIISFKDTAWGDHLPFLELLWYQYHSFSDNFLSAAAHVIYCQFTLSLFLCKGKMSLIVIVFLLQWEIMVWTPGGAGSGWHNIMQFLLAAMKLFHHHRATNSCPCSNSKWHCQHDRHDQRHTVCPSSWLTHGIMAVDYILFSQHCDMEYGAAPLSSSRTPKHSSNMCTISKIVSYYL